MAEDDKEYNFKQLREKVDSLESELETAHQNIDKWRSRALDGVIHQAGYDPESNLVSLVREKFEGEVEAADELTPESFSEFASEYELTPQTSGEDETEETVEDHSADMETFTSKADKVQQATVDASSAPDTDDAIAAAEQEGDWEKSFNLKTQKALQSIGAE